MYARNLHQTNSPLTKNTSLNDLIKMAVSELGAIVTTLPYHNRHERNRIRTLLEKSAVSNQTPTQRTAKQLYLLGFNVLPIPYAQKGGWPWKNSQFTRLPAESIAHLFAGKCNIAVICGKTSQNLFVIDCETAVTFAEQGRKLRENNIPIWSIHSGGAKGGGHYYLRCADGEIENIQSGTLKDVEVRGNRCYTLLPPSVHPDTGALYQWDEQQTLEPPYVHLEEINWLPLRLTQKNRKPNSTVTSEKAAFNNLARKTCDFISNGAPIGERNRRLFAAACDMAGNGFNLHSASNLLAPAANRSGLNEAEIHWTLRSAFHQDREPCRKNKSEPPQIKDWQRVANWIYKQTWSGRTGQTDRVILLACCERAKLGANKQGVFRASIRELSELARLSKPCVIKALKRLRERNWLVYCGEDRTSFAALYQFSEKVIREARQLTNTEPWLSNSGNLTQSSDAGERGALGKTAYFLYEVMLSCGRPLSNAMLAEQARLSRDQVGRALRRLVLYGMVRRQGRMWVAVLFDKDWLDACVAAAAGTLGKGRARRMKHEEERAEYAARQIARARRRMESCSSVDDMLSEMVQDEVVPAVEGVAYWECPNCGQHYFSDDLPDMCDYCQDFTTWRRVEVPGRLGVPIVEKVLRDDVVVQPVELGVQLDLFPQDADRRGPPERE